MAKIFLSYARADIRKARRLYDELSVAGHDVWFDKISLLPGARWEPAIRKAIREARYFVGLFSRHSGSSRGYRHTELKHAMDVLSEYPVDQIYMIPARLEDCTFPDDRLSELNYVNLFPKWGEGVKQLGLALGAPKAETKQRARVPAPPKYQYRVALLDIDMGLKALSALANSLNAQQSLFEFSAPKPPALHRTTTRIDGRSYFGVERVPESFYHEARYLPVDLVALLTRLPLAFVSGNELEYNHFAQSGGPGDRFLFLSTDRLEEYSQLVERTFEEGLVYILTGQLVRFFADTGYHEETRACLMDRCTKRAEIAYGLNERGLCDSCLKTIKMPGLMDAINGLLSWAPKKAK